MEMVDYCLIFLKKGLEYAMQSNGPQAKLILDMSKSVKVEEGSVVPARLGLKAIGKAWLFTASAFQN